MGHRHWLFVIRYSLVVMRHALFAETGCGGTAPVVAE
jgi:hypothetical protein